MQDSSDSCHPLIDRLRDEQELQETASLAARLGINICNEVVVRRTLAECLGGAGLEAGRKHTHSEADRRE